MRTPRAAPRHLLKTTNASALATMRDRRTRVARVTVESVTPVDIIGLYVLIPDLS